MNFCGIICEFNPFHNGHKYIIEEAKKQTGEDVICLMSGDFVQRGEAAIIDKYFRAKVAVENGASATLELPTIYACSNAENFASGAIKILTALGATHLAFGVENTSLDLLQKIAKLKFENTSKFKDAFKNEVQNGINYNTALKRSIAKTIGDDGIIEILNRPNNVLAVEYLTAILKQNSPLLPVAINRCDEGYNALETDSEYLSASGIREHIFNEKDISKFIPKNAKLTYFFSKTHDKTLKTMQILKIKQTNAKELERLYDYSEGIEFRVKSIAEKQDNFEEALEAIATPRYRKPRVNKLLLYPLLKVTKKVVSDSFETKPAVKVLAIDKNKKDILKNFNKKKISLIVTNKDYETLNSKQKSIIDIDLEASKIYNTIIEKSNLDDKKIGTMFI